MQNFPNSFNPNTTFEFDLPEESNVIPSVHSLLGEKVASVISKQLQQGKYRYAWDASNLASGVYLYRLQAGNDVETRKMVLMR